MVKRKSADICIDRVVYCIMDNAVILILIYRINFLIITPFSYDTMFRMIFLVFLCESKTTAYATCPNTSQIRMNCYNFRHRRIRASVSLLGSSRKLRITLIEGVSNIIYIKGDTHQSTTNVRTTQTKQIFLSNPDLSVFSIILCRFPIRRRIQTKR